MLYPNHVGSALIRPDDQGKIRGLSLQAMYEQTGISLDQIRGQIALLLDQAREIQDRITFSEKIYLADCGFEPVIGKSYHLYKRTDGSEFLSMISPEEWTSRYQFTFLTTVVLLSDHTWKVIRK